MSENLPWQKIMQDAFGIPQEIWGHNQLAQILPYVDKYGAPVVEALKLFSVGISTIFIIALAVVIMKKRELDASKEEITVKNDSLLQIPVTGGAYAARWGEIMRHMDSAKEVEWKMAIIEADKLLDLILQRAGFPGGTIGERLMNAQTGQIQALDGLWEAHKIRNRIAHDPNLFIRYTEAKRAIEFYAQTFREFEAI